ncbi:srpk [Apiospora hydei]|uniref:non-specific serine/threonine protein kinase n=1 Tax=Apiospora hydei TaxID=1337664 RepID=A0ABR1VT49_9PEZI
MQVDEYVEDILEYKEGGYAIIEIGDVLKRQYEVVDKLGHSESATVWLCWIQGTHWPRTEWVAIRIFKAQYFKDPPSEEMIKRFELEDNGGWEEAWANAHVAMALAEFFIVDLNGKHKCLVMPVLGPSLEYLGLTRGPTLKGYLYEIALALEYLHHRGIAHGQVIPRNIYFQLDIKSSKVHIGGPADVQRTLGLEERKKLTIEKTPRRPHHQIRPANLGRLAPLGRIVLYPSSSPVGIFDVSSGVLGTPDWFYAPEALRDRREARSRRKCTLGLADANLGDAHLKTHLKILERHLGPTGAQLDCNSGGRLYETEDEYEQWLWETVFPPWKDPLTALLGSVAFRRQLYPKLDEPDAVLPRGEAERLSALLEEALCYDHAKRSINQVLWSDWWQDVHASRMDDTVYWSKIPKPPGHKSRKHSKHVDTTDKQKQPPGASPEPIGRRSLEGQPGPLQAVDYHQRPFEVLGTRQGRSKPQITQFWNPLLQLFPWDVKKPRDILDLDRIIRGVVIPPGGDYITRREDPATYPDYPSETIEIQKQALARAVKWNVSSLVHNLILAVCEAYRDHGEWVLVRVAFYIRRARKEYPLGDKAGYDTTMIKIANVLQEYAKYRAERLEFYRQWLPVASLPLRRKMLWEFHDLQDGEINAKELLRSEPAGEKVEVPQAPAPDGYGTTEARKDGSPDVARANDIGAEVVNPPSSGSRSSADVKYVQRYTAVPKDRSTEDLVPVEDVGNGSPGEQGVANPHIEDGDEGLSVAELSPIQEEEEPISEGIEDDSDNEYTEESSQAYSSDEDGDQTKTPRKWWIKFEVPPKGLRSRPCFGPTAKELLEGLTAAQASLAETREANKVFKEVLANLARRNQEELEKLTVTERWNRIEAESPVVDDVPVDFEIPALRPIEELLSPSWEMLDSFATLLQELLPPDDNNDLTTAFQAGSETPPPTSPGCSPTETSPESDARLWKASSDGPIVLQDGSEASPPVSGDCPPTSSTMYPDDLFTDIEDSLAAALQTASDILPPTSAGNSPAVSETETADILSKAERFVELYLRTLLARLESGDAAAQYVLIFCAAGFLILVILLADVLLVRKGVPGSSMGEEVIASTTGASVTSTRASVTSIGASVASATVKALENWFQARVVSPYSEVREFVRKDPATESQQGDDGAEATRGWASNATAIDWETSFGSYLVTQLSKMARISN